MNILETERLVLRELTQDDFKDLCEIMQDAETMAAYEGAFSEAEVQAWLAIQLRRYRDDGFGLWAVLLKSSGEFVGQAGLTTQGWGERLVPEVGYLFKRAHWHNGYAAEAARGCRDYAFSVLGLPSVYSIIRDSNLASQAVARRNNMVPVGEFVKHYKGFTMPHIVFEVVNQANLFSPP